MQEKHADVCSGVLFWTACTRRPHVLSLPSRCEKSDSWRKTGSVKSAKKSRTVPQCGHVTLNCVQMASKKAKVEFSSHIFQFTRLHGVAVMQGLTFRDSVVTLFKSARWYVLSGTGFLVAHQLLEMWCANARLANQVPTSHHLSFECLGVIVVALNGKSASMLLESTKNKLKQWLVIEKSVNKCNFFHIFWNYNNMNKNNRKTNLWRSNSYI